MAVYDHGFAQTDALPGGTGFVNLAGGALSLALILGVGTWGYQSVMRDVSSIPVVRAMEGEMRVQPDNPGGSVASHTGLAVNEVAALGEAGAPEDLLILAPEGAGLAVEDLAVAALDHFDEGLPPAGEVPAAQPPVQAAPMPAPAGAQVILASAEAPGLPLNGSTEADEIAALLTEITANLTPPPAPEATPAGYALRPTPRPAGQATTAFTATGAAPAPVEAAVSGATFAPGTHLVQLGAFPNPTLAAQEWSRLQRRFGSLLDGYTQVIQVSTQSSGTWYRLRAQGFTDRAEARRLCAALEAEGATCIAVMVD